MATSNPRRGIVAAVGFLALALGCSAGADTGEVHGTVTVDGKTPAAGSSITFIPTGGKGGTAGGTLENGKYSAKVPIGPAKVEIRCPRTVGKAKADAGGYQSQGEIVEESLPARYNDQTELTVEVKSGRTEKNWDLTTDPKKR